MKRCKHCKSPLYPDGQPLPVATPAMRRALLAALRWDGQVGGLECELERRMKDLGLIAEEYAKPEKERVKLKAKYMKAMKLAAQGNYETASKILQDARDYSIDRKETRLTPIGYAAARWYKSKLTPEVKP